jgi:nucleotide-binding universal stress UspA family protein
MKTLSINRILVALDASAVNRSVLQAATTLAVNLDAELNALFIEDINLLRLAELPFAREIVYGSDTGRGINVADMERSMLMQTKRLRELVGTIAQQSRLRIAFDVERGDIASAICHASRQTDLLIIGKNSQLLRQSLKVGTIAQALLSSTHCNLMVLQHGATIERPVVVTFDGSDVSLTAVLLASRLARQDHNVLIVLFPAVNDHRYQLLYNQLMKEITNTSLQIRPVRLPENTVAQILQAIKQYQGRILLLETGCSFLTADQTREIVMQADIPVVLLR